jgi:hypothetical protein
LGELPINGRRGQKDDFNPFAQDASQQHRKRRDERERQAARRILPTPESTPRQPEDIKADLERKQREAMEKLEQKGDVVTPTVAPAPVPVEIPRKKEVQEPQSLTREDRLAELRRKSEALKKAAPVSQPEKSIQPEQGTVQPEPTSAVVETIEEEDDGVDETVTIKAKNKRVKNVFREIETTVDNKQDKRRGGGGRRRVEKKGGGRQKQQKKLDRQKYLEYKYAAKEILDNPQVPEEHRSNVLGQIWAKGERQGIDDCLEFIEQKEAELVLPGAVGNSLRALVKEMTTRR